MVHSDPLPLTKSQQSATKKKQNKNKNKRNTAYRILSSSTTVFFFQIFLQKKNVKVFLTPLSPSPLFAN